ncbi:MAG: putative glycoside hydrolase [bacterium]
MNSKIILLSVLFSFLSVSAEKTSGIYINRYTASGSRFYSLVQKMRENDFNAAVIDIKYDRGEVGVLLPDEFSSVASYDRMHDIEKKVDTLLKYGIKPIARVVCFKDNKLAKTENYRYAVKYAGGDIFHDASGALWVSPYSPFVRKYLIAVAKEAAKIGFKEIQFDYIRYPTDGVKGALSFPEHNGMNGFDIVISFLREAYSELKPYNVEISCDIYGYTVWFDSLYYVMQQLEGMAQVTDAIYPMVYPSHFSDSLYSSQSKEKRTYDIIFNSGEKSIKRIRKYGTKTILYLQDFKWKSSRMGDDYVNNQIKATVDSDADGFILWDPASEYSYFDLDRKEKFPDNKDCFDYTEKREEP